MMDFWVHLPKAAKVLVAVAVGAIGGFLWYRAVGCGTGTCPITSRWYTSTAYGAFVGLLFGLG